MCVCVCVRVHARVCLGDERKQKKRFGMVLVRPPPVCQTYIIFVVMLSELFLLADDPLSSFLASFPGSAQLSIAFPYCKRRKAGRGLGTRLPLSYTRDLLQNDFVYYLSH